MYEFPIKIYEKQMEFKNELDKETDAQILKAVQTVGISVDKEELVKALEYDRHQYDKGYHDAYMQFSDKRAWEEIHAWLVNIKDGLAQIEKVVNKALEQEETND